MQNRILNIQGGVNFRELGGYQTTNAQTVKWHKVIRSASLAELTANDQKKLANYPISEVIDFRSTREVAKAPDKIISPMKYQHIPVFAEDKTHSTKSILQIQKALQDNQQNGYQHMIRVYQDLILTKESQRAYQQFFQTLLTPTEGAVLFHCTAGKDRTGVAALLFLKILGVDLATIKQDYLITNQTTAGKLTEFMTAAQSQGSSQAQLEMIKDTWSANGDYFDTAVNTIQDNYGSVTQFAKEALQISTNDQADLRRIYLN